MTLQLKLQQHPLIDALRHRNRHTILPALILLLTPIASLACPNGAWVAEMVAVEGLVQRQAHAHQEWTPLEREQGICPGDSVRVGKNSRATLYLSNNSITNLDADSLLRFPASKTQSPFWVDLKQGVAHFISRITNRFEVHTPYINAMVEGTEFIVNATDRSAVSVIEGHVTAYNDTNKVQLELGQQATLAHHPQKLSVINVAPGSVVAWAVHYPPVLSLTELPVANEQEKIRIHSAVQSLRQNRVDHALSALTDDALADNAPSASTTLTLARATLLLQLGRLSEFNDLLRPVLESDQSGLAYSLKAIAEIVRNDVSNGMISAKEAVKRAPTQAAAWLALSYAHQANLALDDALASARKATQVQPNSTLAHLRLSELHLSQGDLNSARDVLETLPSDETNPAELEASRGFIQLFHLKLAAAKQHFNKALAMDSANPQYHLGMGLTLLRGGQLAKGRREIEYAVSLDPLRSVLRSYLGRAYFEEKRDHEASKQWTLAKQFDANDPTATQGIENANGTIGFPAPGRNNAR